MAKAKPCSRLKLLIDMKDRVLFAEAGKDFVDNMCMILRSGCVHHLCKGVGLVSEFSILESEAAETYIITDDLIFTPMSTLVLLKIFQKFEISDMDSLSEITATVSDSQLAIVSLRSRTVLTDVLLPSQARQTKRKEENSIQKHDGDNEEGDKRKEDPIESAMRVKPSKRTKMKIGALDRTFSTMALQAFVLRARLAFNTSEGWIIKKLILQ